nr:MAG TPA: hypothetical protein [Caudoviricetes sp.]
MRRGIASLICFFCALRVVCGLAATYREAPGTIMQCYISYLVVGLPFRLLQLCLKGSNGKRALS